MCRNFRFYNANIETINYSNSLGGAGFSGAGATAQQNTTTMTIRQVLSSFSVLSFSFSFLFLVVENAELFLDRLQAGYGQTLVKPLALLIGQGFLGTFTRSSCPPSALASRRTPLCLRRTRSRSRRFSPWSVPVSHTARPFSEGFKWLGQIAKTRSGRR